MTLTQQWKDLAGRDPHPLGASTRTSRRVGISQEDLPHTRVTTSTLRMQEDYKEQHGSHSSNSWKERFALWHRHAGMLTGSEPYKLRGIPSKDPKPWWQGLVPLMREDPGHSPTSNMIVSFSPYTLHLILRVQCHNVFYWKEDKSMVRTMTLMFCTVFLSTGQWPNITYINKECCKVFNWKEDNS